MTIARRWNTGVAACWGAITGLFYSIARLFLPERVEVLTDGVEEMAAYAGISGTAGALLFAAVAGLRNFIHLTK